MLIGIDFDNTLVCYDRLFHALALERAWIPADLPAAKTSVRDYLRSVGREDDWTELQGLAYGPEIQRAELFPGVLDFFREAHRRGIATIVVSHKTRHALRGPKHNLHASALEFLKRQGFFDTAIGLTEAHVFLEPTKVDKLARIATVGCTHFIDDLPEFLAEPDFPANVRKILFDPQRAFSAVPHRTTIHSWRDAVGLLIDEYAPSLELAPEPLPDAVARLLLGAEIPNAGYSLTRIAGGRNNRAYLLTTSDGRRCLVKWYFRHREDARDRLGAEYRFVGYCRRFGIDKAPKPLAHDDDARLGLYEFIDGKKLTPAEIAERHVSQAIEFVVQLQAHRNTPEARALPTASEACFSVEEHRLCIDNRVRALQRVAPEHDALQKFVLDRLLPAWEQIDRGICETVRQRPEIHSAPLTDADHCLSPSDFGFHNALQTADGSLRFFDFEYAGWDDPAKLLCDFFCQVEVPVPLRFATSFAARLAAQQLDPEAFLARAELLFPAYRIKWCCIVLNEFLSSGSARRSFTSGIPVADDRLGTQLTLATQMLDRLATDHDPHVFRSSSIGSTS
ncbi:MAG: phosphotransferase [Planctomycetia bacterium]|nr:phosphotransferase [Planctomycetia bacterium]